MTHSDQLTSKPHYPILDGLRGVAAIMVLAMHLFEPHSTSHLDMFINHGYLAVDFFFLLSGFVIGYAYDDRWGKMSLGNFFQRRLIRLQPMVILGSVVGAICFYFQDSPMFPLIHTTSVIKMLVVMVIGATLIPLPTRLDVRGWAEMHPLDGPAWSLFFEYIANILYALFVRKFSKTLLTILVVIAGAFMVHYLVTGPSGDLIGGWSLEPLQLRIGFTRLMYPFFAGLLLFRMTKLRSIQYGFTWCSLLLIAVLAFPRVGGAGTLWKNGIYEAVCVILVFPMIVYMGAGGSLAGNFSRRLCKFLGDLSYPLYISHYPLAYIYIGWVSAHPHIPIAQAWPRMVLTFVSAIVLAYGYLKLYDEPVRRWLTEKAARLKAGKKAAPAEVVQ
jgi:peptidoglycan/LPS O-acetylase OafA/YrhL